MSGGREHIRTATYRGDADSTTTAANLHALATHSVTSRGQRALRTATETRTGTSTSGRLVECWNCGPRHDTRLKQTCPANSKKCRNCGKTNHFTVKCRSTRKNSAYVGGVEEATDAEVFGATYERASSCRRLDAIQQVTLRVESGNFIRCQPDTGAQCNVLPVDIYKKAMLETSHYRISKT